MSLPVTAAFSAIEFHAALDIVSAGVGIASGRDGLGLALERPSAPRPGPGRTAVARPSGTPWGPR